MKQIFRFSAIALLVMVCACSQHEGIMRETMPSSYDEAMGVSNRVSEDMEISDTHIELQRKIIKEGTIQFETANASKTRKLIQKSINEQKGYIANDQVRNYGGTNGNHTITIRVPAEKFDLLLDQISTDKAHRIDNKEIKALDVTEEFIDVEARIKTKKELENRYKELLKQAHKVDDILSIEKELGTLRTEIESIEGRLRYLKDKVAYSTLTFIFYEKGVSDSSYSFGFGEKFIEALYDGWTNILWFIIGLTNLWPFIIITIFVVFIIKRIRKNRKRKKDTYFPPVK